MEKKQYESVGYLCVIIKKALEEAVDLGLEIIWFDNSYIWQNRYQLVGLHHTDNSVCLPLETSERDILDILEVAIRQYKARIYVTPIGYQYKKYYEELITNKNKKL